MLKKKKNIIGLTIIVLIIVGRLLLPYFLEKYVNKTLNDIPGYTGHVEDIDVALFRGAYVIEGLILDKENAGSPAPLLDFPETDISLEWSALFRGKIVSEIILHNPELNYIFEDQQKEDEAEVKDWSEALTDLVPIDINHLQVHSGRINFVQFSADPTIDLIMEQIEMTATNLRNVRQTESRLPSSVNATAVSFGGGDVSLNGRVDVIKRIPDMDVEFSLEKADVTALNELTMETAGVDFASGTFGLFSEFAIADGYLKGYLKPMFINTELLGEEDDDSFFRSLWEGFVGVFKFLFKNQGTDTLATRAPLEGNLNNVDTGIFSTVLNIFKNAWIEAFNTEIDEDINYGDAVNPEEEQE